MPSSSVPSWGSVCELDTVLSSSGKFAGHCYKELLRSMEKWHLAASSQCSLVLSRVYPNIFYMVPNLSKHPDLNPCDCFLFSEPKLQHEGEDLQTRHWQHTWQTNSHSEKFHTYFHKHTVVCCHQVTQLQGGYLEESKFQNCGRTYTDMLQNQSQNFLRVSRECTGVSS